MLHDFTLIDAGPDGGYMVPSSLFQVTSALLSKVYDERLELLPDGTTIRVQTLRPYEVPAWAKAED